MGPRSARGVDQAHAAPRPPTCVLLVGSSWEETYARGRRRGGRRRCKGSRCDLSRIHLRRPPLPETDPTPPNKPLWMSSLEEPLGLGDLPKLSINRLGGFLPPSSRKASADDHNTGR
ncbi:hypothetical protein HU200_049897 [Digitaria exilis]|uniref:Uncharacterized protein n=1 Tax=Digitaria exilis TaxID=1010633 RepID=A0A835E9F9_9POAL|nr:hypothetical protein HU200_049897 [Digitaria exilis]